MEQNMIQKKIAHRLSSKKGESLTELLAALLVASLGLTMFASALTASKHMMELGQKKMDSYYTGRNSLEVENDSSQQTLGITEAGNNNPLNIGNSENGTGIGSYNVNVYRGNSGSTQIWRYKRSE